MLNLNRTAITGAVDATGAMVARVMLNELYRWEYWPWVRNVLSIVVTIGIPALLGLLIQLGIEAYKESKR